MLGVFAEFSIGPKNFAFHKGVPCRAKRCRKSLSTQVPQVLLCRVYTQYLEFSSFSVIKLEQFQVPATNRRIGMLCVSASLRTDEADERTNALIIVYFSQMAEGATVD